MSSVLSTLWSFWHTMLRWWNFHLGRYLGSTDVFCLLSVYRRGLQTLRLIILFCSSTLAGMWHQCMWFRSYPSKSFSDPTKRLQVAHRGPICRTFPCCGDKFLQEQVHQCTQAGYVSVTVQSGHTREGTCRPAVCRTCAPFGKREHPRGDVGRTESFPRLGGI